MPEVSRPPQPDITPDGTADIEEYKTKVFTKSGYPRTFKQNIRVILNLVLNFFF